MNDFRKKKAARRILYSPLTLSALLIVAIFMGKAAWNVHAKELTSAEALERSQSELDKLTARQTSLNSAVAYLSTPAGVETEIRTKFRVTKEGESLAVILDDASSTASSSSAAVAASSTSFWYRLMHLFSSK
jgi:cell division protein FtsB